MARIAGLQYLIWDNEVTLAVVYHDEVPDGVVHDEQAVDGHQDQQAPSGVTAWPSFGPGPNREARSP